MVPIELTFLASPGSFSRFVLTRELPRANGERNLTIKFAGRTLWITPLRLLPHR